MSGRYVVPYLQFRRQLSKEIMDNTIGMDDNNYGRPTPATSPQILFVVTHFKSNPTMGIAKDIRKVEKLHINIQITMPQL